MQITLYLLTTIWLLSLLNLILPMHPLSLGIMILCLALFSCTLTAMSNPWYAYMLFFVYIGGMLVMFAYIASLSPNSTFSINTQMSLLTSIPLIILNMKYHQYPNNSQVPNSITKTNELTEQTFTFLYTQSGSTLLILLALILLLTMIIVVKMCNLSSGPLRPFTGK
uniref:NADH-ubiquinone oxidoreductase chain 6 n=1 Tax=Anodontites trapesialis TaxID=1961152 RepID=A0A1Y9T606_9BIVA|nr:NADH dehydrogenase subunit 6 [Anodontites trapesialis]